MSERFLQYLPPEYEKIREFVELAKTESIEFDLMEQAIDRLYDERYILTSSEETIVRREQMLGIKADPSTESLEFRKVRLINRYSMKPPFTTRYLQEQLDRLVGEGHTLASVDVENFILTVAVPIKDANVFKEIEHTIHMIKPANMIYQQHTALPEVIEIKESIKAMKVIWNYKLDGSWKLGDGKSFASLGQEVIIK